MEKEKDITVVYDAEPEAQKTKELTTVQAINRQLSLELSDPATKRALIATTFKNFSDTLMHQAMLEGMLRGFQFKDFLERNVYAIKYGDGYSLITSIDNARKRAMRNKHIGTDKPVYTYSTGADGQQKIETCEVTVKRLVDTHVAEFTALVYYDEFYKEGKTYNGKYTKSMWDLKPHAMIAKVAEMHALRKAFPDDLSQIYVEEEFDNRPALATDRFDAARQASGDLKMTKLDDTTYASQEEPRVHEAEEDAPTDTAADNTAATS